MFDCILFCLMINGWRYFVWSFWYWLNISKIFLVCRKCVGNVLLVVIESGKLV